MGNRQERKLRKLVHSETVVARLNRKKVLTDAEKYQLRENKRRLK